MPKPLPLNLTEPQRQELTWQREQPRQPSLRERCAALLMLAQGESRACHMRGSTNDENPIRSLVLPLPAGWFSWPGGAEGTWAQARVFPFVAKHRIGTTHMSAFSPFVRASYPTATRIRRIQDTWPLYFHPDALLGLEP